MRVPKKKKKKLKTCKEAKHGRGSESKPTLNYMKYEFKAKEVYPYEHKYE